MDYTYLVHSIYLMF